MSSLPEELKQLVPALRRYARVVLLNKTKADQLVSLCLAENMTLLKSHNPELVRKKLFHHLSRLIAKNSVNARKQKEIASVALRNLLNKQQQASSQAQTLIIAMSQLTQSEREILFLAALEGFHYKDIGKMTGNSLSTVMTRLHKAREQLRGYVFGAVAV